MKKKVSQFFSDEFSYKIVAFFIAMILWLTILGRRDLVLTKDVTLEFISPPYYSLVRKPRKTIEVKVSGPRTALQKFSRNIEDTSVTFDLNKYKPGRVRIPISKDLFEIPLGVKLISVSPDHLNIVIKQTGKKK
jgi:YbbR domain-containing protein